MIFSSAMSLLTDVSFDIIIDRYQLSITWSTDVMNILFRSLIRVISWCGFTLIAVVLEYKHS